MGIQGMPPRYLNPCPGLLPLLKSIHKPTHLRNFAGQTLGVDAYGWLHRGTVSCAIELAQQKPTRRYVDFAMSRVRMLLHFGVKPYVVFDGDYLPSKAQTEHDRAARRKESKRLGLDLLGAGKTGQAQLELQKAVDVTPLMARALVEELKAAGVEYIVAPYEADAQLAFLEKCGIIDGIISEDSDLLVFGAKCLLTKLDQYGECIMINRQHFTACREISLVGWTDAEFRMMAILSGCDYLPGIDKLGLKTAHRLVRKHKTIQRIVKTIQFDGKLKIRPDYLEAFTKAERTFLYQWVFCPKARCLLNLNTIPDNILEEKMPYFGSYITPQIAAGVAVGDLHPNSKEPLQLGPNSVCATKSTSAAQTPLGKDGKSIAEFFRPKRTPLAELDPNTFTPSRSQRDIIERHERTSWYSASTSTVPAVDPRIITARSSTDPRLPKRASLALPGASKTSPKRQRLCFDNHLAAAMHGDADLTSAQSKFFNSRGVGAASIKGKPSTKAQSSCHFDVHVDEHAGQNQTVDAAKSAETTLFDEIGEDCQHKSVPLTEATGRSPEFKRQQLANKIKKSKGESEDTARILSTPCPRRSLHKGLRAKNHSAEHAVANSQQKRFSTGPPERNPAQTRASQLVPPDLDNLEMEQRLFADSGIELKPNMPRGSFTRDSIEVLNSPPGSNASGSQKGTAEMFDDGADDSQFVERIQQPLFPNMGSEDFIVPNSPGDEWLQTSHTGKLNLKKFAFCGQ